MVLAVATPPCAHKTVTATITNPIRRFLGELKALPPLPRLCKEPPPSGLRKYDRPSHLCGTQYARITVNPRPLRMLRPPRSSFGDPSAVGGTFRPRRLGRPSRSNTSGSRAHAAA